MESSIEPEDTDRLFDDSPEPEQQPDDSVFGLIIYNISVYFQNPWILLALAGLAYYVYQNYLSNIRLPTRSRDDQVTPQDEEKVREMMEARARQQAKYDQAAKDLEEKMKNEPPPKLGPISKQIADQAKVKAKLRPEYNPLMGDQSSSGPPKRSARASAGGGG